MTKCMVVWQYQYFGNSQREERSRNPSWKKGDLNQSLKDGWKFDRENEQKSIPGKEKKKWAKIWRWEYGKYMQRFAGQSMACGSRANLSITLQSQHTLYVHVLNDFISLGLFSIDYLSSEPCLCCFHYKVPFVFDIPCLYDGMLYNRLITCSRNNILKCL